MEFEQHLLQRERGPLVWRCKINRERLIDWFLEVCYQFEQELSVIFQAIELFDRFQEKQTSDRLDLLACLLLSNKLLNEDLSRELYVDDLAPFLQASDQALAMAEKRVWSTLDHDLNCPTIVHFLRQDVEIWRKALIQVSHIDYLANKPSTVALKLQKC